MKFGETMTYIPNRGDIYNNPIPAPLRGTETGTFAHFTIMVRMPEIGRRIIPENHFPAEIVERLQALIAELTDPHSRIRPLQDPNAPDEADWERYTLLYREMSWLEAPWFFAETYYYRRILEATGYFQPGPWQGFDPYTYQKQQGLAAFQGAIQAACELVGAWLPDLASDAAQAEERLRRLIFLNLWGNQADLSMWPVQQKGQTAKERPDHADADQQQAHTLCDHSRAAAAYLFSLPAGSNQVDFILDNAGLELVNDLLLADFLLSANIASTINFHLKSHPTFVSDAMLPDVIHTLDFLAGLSHPTASSAADRLRGHIQNRRLALETHFFWTSPLAMWELVPELRETLSHSALIISKGDANYRRLIGDRHWPYDAPISAVWRYLPAPLLALRVSKSELMIGLQPGQAEHMHQVDPKWLYNGRWGLVQFNPPRGRTPRSFRPSFAPTDFSSVI